MLCVLLCIEKCRYLLSDYTHVKRFTMKVPLFNRLEENTGYVIAQKHKPSPAPPKPSGPATPAPTPWLQFGSKAPISAGLYRDLTQSSLARAASSIPAGGQLGDGTVKMRVTQPMDREGLISSSVGVAWQASKSQVLGSSTAVQLNTPKILELDVNRVMIGQTDVRYIVIIFIQTQLTSQLKVKP